MKLYQISENFYQITNGNSHSNLISESETIAPVLETIASITAAQNVPTDCPPVEIVTINEETGEAQTQTQDENQLTQKTEVSNDTNGGWYLVLFQTPQYFINVIYVPKGVMLSLPTSPSTTIYKGSLNNILNFLQSNQ